ncbi:MAG: hypothetical protein ACREAY_04490 [Nitrososphaera sp.]|uniref:hypothetical protein n=1 Tax=Nitrososphaera sp. TaxID=1971748 RepID=UPI003D6F28B6
MKPAAVLAVLLLFGVLTTGGEAYAKGPIYNPDYTYAQYLQMVIIPLIVASGLLVMIAAYTRQGVKASA